MSFCRRFRFRWQWIYCTGSELSIFPYWTTKTANCFTVNALIKFMDHRPLKKEAIARIFDKKAALKKVAQSLLSN